VARLALEPNKPLTRPEIVAALWGDAPPSDPDAVLNPLLSKIRRVLGADRLSGRTEIELVDRGDVFVDARYAVEAVHRAESFMGLGRWAEGTQPGHTAYQIANRPFLAGHDADWIDEWRRRLEDIRNRGLECYVTGSLRAGTQSLTAAETGARRLVELAPFRESAYGLLMEVLEQRGNFAEALLVYETLRRLLRDELGVSPSPALQKLHGRLLEAAS
jgi:DNA-binding SARP family transcriptional activator